MYDLRFYSEYFFRAQPDIDQLNEIKSASIKTRQQLLNESASAAEGLAHVLRSTAEQYGAERTATPQHSVGAQIKK